MSTRSLARRSAVLSLVTALLLIVSVAGCSGREEGPRTLEEVYASRSPFPTGTVTVTTDEGTLRFDVDVAETDYDRQRGLMFRESLAPDAGMAFLFDAPVNTSFWMKNTRIPLSIAFWDSSGRVVEVLDMDPCRTQDCPLYEPSGDYVGALEVNQGALAAVEPGDAVELSR